ncbi:toxin-antitoxin system, antitoxin component domain protein [Brevibacterium aurantiacum]|uniref:Toxin-antitoxin system, antitoxin component domain protein n=1 Tax=Brevibacterium aurantiacum TaxID=273384 RepID=A0A2A3YXP7_BREAU|nr:toxin-antitoxin system, antitoxin component domain protein [Brevibacterium aurantiacum]PCC44110.1 toxin-antitoxin system, antitoxin component domain protein [Brevibacterium aurantiacum]
MVIIRLASLTERSEFSPWAELLSSQEIAAIRATRNIAAHAGYAVMNDELFWEAVTVSVPEIVERLLNRG